MSFDLHFPTQEGVPWSLELSGGQMLFVLGANGTGKSSLMLHFANRNAGKTRRISAHRQTWMKTDALDMTPAIKLRTEQYIQSTDHALESRYRDDYAQQRASMAIYELINAENVRARRIAAPVDSGDLKMAAELAKKEAPIKIINKLLLQSNLPVEIDIRENERIVARKNGGPEYSAAELSDGERNALLLASNVLTAPDDSLLVIDEPERHLHRSIISPLLKQLFECRLDCGFVISTHDQDLPLQIPTARVLLLRACRFDGRNVQSWDADELSADLPIDESIKRDLLGSRRKILFVEGTEHSLDKSLYSLIFPMASVIPKGSCRNVERAVDGIRATEEFHRVRAFGIIDGDGYVPAQVQRKRRRGVYAVPFYSVESIYYHPKIIEYIARRQADLLEGEDSSALLENALDAAVGAVRHHTERLSQKVAMRLVRKLIIEQVPKDDILAAGHPVTLQNDAPRILSRKKTELDSAVSKGDWEAILRKCSVRESESLDAIARALKFPKRQVYEQAVRRLLMTDKEAVASVRGLFEDLFDQLSKETLGGMDG